MKARHQIVMSGVDDALVVKVVTRLIVLGADFHRVPSLPELATLAAGRDFDLVLLGPSVLGRAVDDTVRKIRSATSLSRYALVVAVARRHQLRPVRRLVGRGVDRVVSIDDPGSPWQDVMFDLLDVSRRVRVAAPVTVEQGELAFSCRTENVSISGMLLHCAAELPSGSTLRFVLSVPGEEEPIRGEARVTRAANPRREGVDGFGAEILSFEEAGHSRLRYFLSRQT